MENTVVKVSLSAKDHRNHGFIKRLRIMCISSVSCTILLFCVVTSV